MTPSTTTLKVKNKLPFGIVPNALLEDKRLSLQARALAAWLCGRSDGFEIRVESLKRILGISDKIWASSRRELENIGWWRSRKFRVPSEKGKNQGRPIFRWEHEFEFLEGEGGSTCIPPYSRDANCADAKGGNKQTRLNQKEKEEKKKNVDVVGEVEKFGDFSITSQKDKSEKTSAEGEAKGGEGQGPQTQDQGQGYLLLIREGVREEVARVLAESHTKERIEEVVRMASDKKLSNKPGFMVRSLEEGWIDAPATGKRTKNKTRRWVSIERNIFKFDPLAKKEDSKEDENDIWAFAARKEREAYEREIQEERERLSHTGKRG